MTKKASKVNFTTITESVGLNDPGLGVLFMMGPTEWGEHYKPNRLITNKAQFKRYYGGRLLNSNFPMLVERALDAGVNVRISRVPGSGAATSEGTNPVDDSNGNEIFTLVARGSGAYYSDIVYDIAAVSASDPAAHKLTITLGSITEEYTFVPPIAGAAAPYTYLDEVVQNSELVTVRYADVSAVAQPITLPAYSDETFQEVSNAGPVTNDASYTDNIDSFDEYYDGICIVIPEELSASGDKILVASALSAYAEARKDLIAVIGASPSLGNELADIQGYFSSIETQNSKFTVFTRGGLQVIDQGTVKNITESVDVAALFINQYNSKPWYSPSGLSKGKLSNVYGVVSNLGTPGLFETLDLVTRDGINSVVKKNGVICLWNAYTMAEANSQDRFLNVVMLEIYLNRVISPTMEEFLSEPNDPETWLSIYYRVKPLLDSMISERAAYEVEWKGDQFVTSLDDLEINTLEDVQNGDYKAILEAKLISPIVTITIEFYKQSLNS